MLVLKLGCTLESLGRVFGLVPDLFGVQPEFLDFSKFPSNSNVSQAVLQEPNRAVQEKASGKWQLDALCSCLQPPCPNYLSLQGPQDGSRPSFPDLPV